MQVRMKRGILLAALSLAVGFFSYSDEALAACKARFNCGFGPNPACFFVIRSYGRDKYFTVSAGSSQMIYGLQANARYCESDDGYPDGDNCRQRPVNLTCN